MIRASRSLFSTTAVVLALLALTGCERSPPAADNASAAKAAGQAAWSSFVDRVIEQSFVLSPPFAVSAGRHEFDGQLPDWSAAGFARELELLEKSRDEAAGFGDAALSAEQRFQRDYVIAVLDREIFWLRDARQPFTNVSYYFDHGLDPATYITVPYAPVDERLRAFIRYAKAIPGALAQVRANLQTPMPRTFVEYGWRGFKGFADFYRNDVPQAFAEVKDEALQAELKAAIEPAAQAMMDMSQWVEAQRAQATDDYALGAERFAAMLNMTERVTTPLDRLGAIGRADLERNLAALADACKQYLPRGTIAQCVAKQEANKPQGGPVVAARAQLTELRQYLVDHDIVSIPGTEEAKVDAAPPYNAQNAAYINIPGPYETNMPSVYYIAPPDPTWTRAEQLAYIPGEASLLFTSVHEVWPGHFLQFLHSNRSLWRFGQLMVGYAFAEGWAHYTEEMMVEQGLAQNSPERHIGQLLNALLRNVRYVCAIGLHTQGMKVSECEQLFRDKAYQDAGNARQQAARGTYDPAYLNYTMGKLMIRRLYADWQAENRGKSLKQFHDQFLSHGGPPIPLVRAQMLKNPGDELF
ncbi:MAG TPA: DUF885 domain-containing protein [Povalibacter sp.]|uniref:DUF885 domain-containing protein n=1 Tax=Povalibacter sp. TaxID=1962978 RepID=UPI002C0326DD|nr:DUF885 domain-containing protein [Povalibacter sp.]HMN45271.1 DUF885 domain-containing protein [Povalibacter sp.]